MTLYPPPPGGPQFTAGTQPHGNQATQDLDVLIQQPLAFCTAGIAARVRQVNSQSLGSGTYTTVSFDTVDEDPYGGWNSGSHYWMPPAGCSGWYEVTVTALVSQNTTGFRTAVAVTGTLQYTVQQSGPSTPYIQSGTTTVYLFGGVDYVQCQVHADTSGLSTDVTAGQQSLMHISWISS